MPSSTNLSPLPVCSLLGSVENISPTGSNKFIYSRGFTVDGQKFTITVKYTTEVTQNKIDEDIRKGVAKTAALARFIKLGEEGGTQKLKWKGDEGPIKTENNKEIGFFNLEKSSFKRSKDSDFSTELKAQKSEINRIFQSIYGQKLKEKPALHSSKATSTKTDVADKARPKDYYRITSSTKPENIEQEFNGNLVGMLSFKLNDITIEVDSTCNTREGQPSICNENVEAIVNAANTRLENGGGVCGAIMQRAGERELVAACHAQEKSLNPGAAIITSSFDLGKNGGAIKHIIHTPAPDHRKSVFQMEPAIRGTVVNKDKKTVPTPANNIPALPHERDQLYACYYNSLVIAHNQGIKSIAFPPLGVGIFEFPVREAADITAAAVRDFVADYPDTSIKLIKLDVTSPFQFDAYERSLINMQSHLGELAAASSAAFPSAASPSAAAVSYPDPLLNPEPYEDGVDMTEETF